MAGVYTDTMNESKITVVEDVNFGIYVWVTEDRKVVKDQFGNFMNIPGVRGDLRAQKALGDAARHYGIEGGKAVFIEGSRRISDDEYQEQLGRMIEGLVPDENDPGVLKDALKGE